MEGLHNLVRTISKDPKSVSSALPDYWFKFSGKDMAASVYAFDQSSVLITRPPRQVILMWTCSKLCMIFFAAGVVSGYTLKRCVRHWVPKLIKRLDGNSSPLNACAPRNMEAAVFGGTINRVTSTQNL